jgi:hypothetical protein
MNKLFAIMGLSVALMVGCGTDTEEPASSVGTSQQSVSTVNPATFEESEEMSVDEDNAPPGVGEEDTIVDDHHGRRCHWRCFWRHGHRRCRFRCHHRY